MKATTITTRKQARKPRQKLTCTPRHHEDDQPTNPPRAYAACFATRECRRRRGDGHLARFDLFDGLDEELEKQMSRRKGAPDGEQEFTPFPLHLALPRWTGHRARRRAAHSSMPRFLPSPHPFSTMPAEQHDIFSSWLQFIHLPLPHSRCIDFRVGGRPYLFWVSRWGLESKRSTAIQQRMRPPQQD